MRSLRWTLAAAALLLAAAPAAAQPGGPPLGAPDGPQPMRQEEMRPMDALLDVRQELQLTDPQVTRLQQIAQRLEQTNRPLRQRLAVEWARWREQRRQELERMTPAERSAELERLQGMGRPPVPEPLRPLVAQMRMNVGAALREAGGVLTPRQKARMRQLMEARRRMDGGRMGPGARRPLRGQGRFPHGRP
jgi:Spy/CpxP family protein refolding chaperone